jgi:hypothetical protein
MCVEWVGALQLRHGRLRVLSNRASSHLTECSGASATKAVQQCTADGILGERLCQNLLEAAIPPSIPLRVKPRKLA